MFSGRKWPQSPAAASTIGSVRLNASCTPTRHAPSSRPSSDSTALSSTERERQRGKQLGGESGRGASACSIQAYTS
eukprot:1506409-Rhodomonas_salina.1